MAITVSSSGTQTSVVSTEHTLATVTFSGAYVLGVDMTNLANGDVLELRIYTKCLNGGTERLAYYGAWAHAQATLMKYSPPIPSPVSIKATLKQTAGTARDYPWSLMQVDA